MTPDELASAQVAFNLASRLLYVEPSDEEVERYLAPQLFSEAPFAMDNGTVRAGLALLDAWCAEARKSIASGSESLHRCACDLRCDWLNLLVGVGEPKAPSWAGYYLNPSSVLIGESALGVRRLYQAHGFRIERQNQEPDDNLGIMLEFIAMLIQLELDGDGDAARECQIQLLQKYVLPWLPLWHWSVEKFARTSFYHGVGDMVFGFVQTYAARFGFRYCDDEKSPQFVWEGQQ